MKRVFTTVLSIFILSLMFALNIKNEILTNNYAFAQDGTCCNELGTNCVVGDITLYNKYFKTSGPCKSIGFESAEVTP